MPTDYRRYPKNWRQFSDHIRFGRAASRCECTGQCGLHQPNPNTRRCLEEHHTPAKYAKGTIRLTVAHLCGCDPPCAIASHVIAACQRCHLRIDRFQHAQARLRTQANPARKIYLATRPPGEPPWLGAGNARGYDRKPTTRRSTPTTKNPFQHRETPP